MIMPKERMKALATARVRLAPLTESDLRMVLDWRNAARERFLDSGFVSFEDHRSWFRRYLDRDNDFDFVIWETRALNRPVGRVALYDIDWRSRSAQYGRLVIGDAEALGTGIAREATELLLGHAFKDLGLEEVRLVVLRGNERAIGLYRHCGFKVVKEDAETISMVNRRWDHWDSHGIASRIDRMWTESEGELAYRNELVSLLERHGLLGGHILEVGCGSGLVYGAMTARKQELSERYVGVDTSHEMLEIARKRFPSADFRFGDAFRLPFPDRSFDLVIAFEVLSHLPRPEDVLRELMRVGRKVAFTLWTSPVSSSGVETIDGRNFLKRIYSHDEAERLILEVSGGRPLSREPIMYASGTSFFTVGPRALVSGVDAVVVLYRSEACWLPLESDLLELSKGPVNIYFFDNTGNPKTLSVALNDLVRCGNSEFICFVNPHMRLGKEWDSRLVRALQGDSRLGVTSPCPFSSPGPVRLPSDIVSPFLVHAPPTLEEMAALADWSRPFQEVRVFKECSAGFFCAMLRRDLFEDMCGFDERFRLYGLDIDFQWRMRKTKDLYVGEVHSCVAYYPPNGSLALATQSGDLDFKDEFGHMGGTFHVTQTGTVKPWHELPFSAREAVRSHPVYGSMPRQGAQ